MKTNNSNSLVKKYLLSVALASCVGMTTACVKETERIIEKEVPAKQSGTTQNGVTEVIVSEKATADELALAAEQLAGPYTFMLSYKTASMALEKDPKNLKAQFYYKLFKGFEAFRGYAERIQPMLKTPQQLAEHQKWINNFPNSPVKEFLTDKSKPVFNKVSDMQSAVGQYFEGLIEFRQFLKDNQAAQLELYLNPHVFENQLRQQLVNSCTYNEQPDGSYTVACKYDAVASKKLNTADLIALRQMVSGWAMYSFLNNYTADGIELLDQKNPHKPMTNEERSQFLFSQAGFGKLRQGHTWSLLKDMGADLSSAIKWAQQYQSSVCPKGENAKNQRPGYLFNDGICIDQGNQAPVARFLAVLDQALQGVTRMELKTSNDQIVHMNVNAFAWSKNPIQDLRTVRPNHWNNCDQAISLADNTLGGVFVDGDFNILMNKQCN